MKSEWLATRSFERAQRVIAAINTIAIHTKLTLSGVSDSSRIAETARAKEILLSFLENFESILDEARRDREGTVMGTDPRLGSLARKFLSESRQVPQRSPLYAMSLGELRDLLRSNDPDDQKRLVESLRGLRALMEQHTHTDVLGLIGDE